MILGLPGEDREMVLETLDYVNALKPFGVKFQLLHVLKGTLLASDYEAGKFEAMSEDAYMELIGACIARTDPGIVLHRVTGDGPKSLLIAPLWSGNKREVLNRLARHLKEQNIWQGRDFISADNTAAAGLTE